VPWLQVLALLLLGAHQGISLSGFVAVAGSMMQVAVQSLRAQVVLVETLVGQVRLRWMLAFQLFCVV
jgi:hypothetical protein